MFSFFHKNRFRISGIQNLHRRDFEKPTNLEKPEWNVSKLYTNYLNIEPIINGSGNCGLMMTTWITTTENMELKSTTEHRVRKISTFLLSERLQKQIKLREQKKWMNHNPIYWPAHSATWSKSRVRKSYELKNKISTNVNQPYRYLSSGKSWCPFYPRNDNKKCLNINHMALVHLFDLGCPQHGPSYDRAMAGVGALTALGKLLAPAHCGCLCPQHGPSYDRAMAGVGTLTVLGKLLASFCLAFSPQHGPSYGHAIAVVGALMAPCNLNYAAVARCICVIQLGPLIPWLTVGVGDLLAPRQLNRSHMTPSWIMKSRMESYTLTTPLFLDRVTSEQLSGMTRKPFLSCKDIRSVLNLGSRISSNRRLTELAARADKEKAEIDRLIVETGDHWVRVFLLKATTLLEDDFQRLAAVNINQLGPNDTFERRLCEAASVWCVGLARGATENEMVSEDTTAAHSKHKAASEDSGDEAE